MQRVTVIVGAGLMAAANHVEVLLGKARDLNTFLAAGWSDGTHAYAVSSGQWSEAQIAGVSNPAIIAELMQAGPIPALVDPALAGQAQSAFELHAAGLDEDGSPLPVPQAAPDRIIAISGSDPLALLAQAGLQRL
ncbi:hypothetical protein RA19_07300 [Leisingera sp. ANG-M1]|uniref:hypothetical protein n=1 Tax=Leisingera sp. ANG-M1 TaxID=1577895 RepID=UPI00057DB661|nr:hypothetical protein [Leisingera sp. ANG-M1]KIC11156.1 hypothetical protein RA19_07300 [Leisingera sp. ANG-M1]